MKEKVMKHRLFFTLIAALFLMASCGTDNDVDPSVVVFDTTSPERNSFDQWLQDNYNKPYNINFIYRYIDKETDQAYNVVPAEYDKAKALAIMIKHVWLDAYAEAVGEDFIKTYTPRVYQLIGSAEYSSGGNNSIKLGTAEGGLKVTVFRVNAINPSNPWIDQESIFPNTSADNPMDMNFWFFHTLHHEFCHILTQTKNYSTEFQTISSGDYQTTNWVNVDDSEAPAMGFTSGYGSSEYNEDFAEIYAYYVTHTPETFEKLLQAAIIETDVQATDNNGNPIYKKDSQGNYIPQTDDNGNIVYQRDPETGKIVYTKDADGNYIPVPAYVPEMKKDYTAYNKLVAKFNILHDYFRLTWGIDLEKLRDVVLKRSKEVENGVDISDNKMCVIK